MQYPPPSPIGAGAEALDVITALALEGMAAVGPTQTALLRLIAVVSAHYNWLEDHLSLGQDEMARLIADGYLELLRPGVRGRVALYRLTRAPLTEARRAIWEQAGADYARRMEARVPSNVVRVDFPQHHRAPNHPWAAAQHHLSRDYPGLYNRWFRDLHAAEPDHDGLLQITAPSERVAGYVATRLMMNLERAVHLGYGQPFRCHVVARDKV